MIQHSTTTHTEFCVHSNPRILFACEHYRSVTLSTAAFFTIGTPGIGRVAVAKHFGSLHRTGRYINGMFVDGV